MRTIRDFLPFLLSHGIFILCTTIAFFFILFKMKFLKKELRYILLLIIVLLQSLFLFGDYNTFSDTYYPNTKLTSLLQKLPKGNILEVGNLSFPPNLNLIYHLQNAQSDDAINVASYQIAFNNAFPIKNQWRKTEVIELQNLQKFAIEYIISDYDINLKKENVQSIHDTIGFPIITQTVTIPFTATHESLKQIRLLTANFNRLNTCTLFFSIKDQENILQTQKIPCSDIRDTMYYSIPFTDISLEIGKQYSIIVSAEHADKSNAISFWGDKSGHPFLQTLYENGNTYKELWHEKSVYLFQVSDSTVISGADSFQTIIDKENESAWRVSLNTSKTIVIKKTWYPGWQIFVDGVATKPETNTPFVAVTLTKGTHIIKVSYTPFSFYLGLITSFLTGAGLLIYFVRKEKNTKWYKTQKTNLETYRIKIRKSTKWYQHMLVLFAGIISGSAVYVFIIIKFPSHFTIVKTSAVNWFTIHKYPKTQEQFYFLTAFSFILLFAICIWGVWLWKKIKK